MDSEEVFFDYELPESRIADRPVSGDRSLAKLLVAQRFDSKLSIRDLSFADLPDVLCPGDLLVFNNSRVFPARLFAVLPRSSRQIEILLVERNPTSEEAPPDEESWLALVKPMKKLRCGDELEIDGKLRVIVGLRSPEGRFVELRLISLTGESIPALIDKLGLMPIPPYIRRGLSDEADRDDYQTVFAEKHGSIAAPTAGLHFSPKLLDILRKSGINSCFVTLHVGPSSFLPIGNSVVTDSTSVPENVLSQTVLPERFELSWDTWSQISQAKQEGRRVIAVGTTVARTLETIALSRPFASKSSLARISQAFPSRAEQESVKYESAQFLSGDGALKHIEVDKNEQTCSLPAIGSRSRNKLEKCGLDFSSGCFSGASDLFIRPGFKFKVVDGLITNFHQPRTTHLLLVGAFMAGATEQGDPSHVESVREIYQHALSRDYRFLSYGDGMLLFP